MKKTKSRISIPVLLIALFISNPLLAVTSYDGSAPYDTSYDQTENKLDEGYSGEEAWKAEEGECPTRPGETQKACFERLENQREEVQVEWELPQVEEEEKELPKLRELQYAGSPGWESEEGDCPTRPGETQEMCLERLKNQREELQAEWSLPEIDDSEDLQFSGSDGSQYANQRLAGRTDREGGSGGSSGNGGSYSSSGNAMSSSSGGSSTPSGHNSNDPYSGVPKSGGDDVMASNDGYSNQYDNSDYLGDDVNKGNIMDDGSFGGYGSDSPEKSKSVGEQYNEGSEDDNHDDLYKEKEETDWKKVLRFCVMQIPFEGVEKTFAEKNCRRAVRKHCEFDPEDHDVKGPADCDPFAPWNR